jgi:putative heme iron utilization protein
MSPANAAALRALIESQQVAALATLHRGKPAVSMVPYALLPSGEGFVVHVSRLATHTADMLAGPDVALLITANPASAPPRELPRLSIQGRATQLAGDSGAYSVARERYLARFPDSAELFGFADFSLFTITAQSARFVGGFANATTILGDELRAVLAQGAGRAG